MATSIYIQNPDPKKASGTKKHVAMEHLLFLDDFFHVFSTETSLFSCGGFPMVSMFDSALRGRCAGYVPSHHPASFLHLTGPHGGVESDDIHFLGFTQKA